MVSQKSMPVTISATQVQRKFGEVVRRVYSGHEHFVVEKDGLPVLAIISKQEYDELIAERERHEQEKQARLGKFEQAARAIGKAVESSGLTEDEIMAKVEEARQKLHEEGYGAKPAG